MTLSKTQDKHIHANEFDENWLTFQAELFSRVFNGHVAMDQATMRGILEHAYYCGGAGAACMVIRGPESADELHDAMMRYGERSGILPK